MIKTDMEQYYNKLLSLLDQIPEYNISISRIELTKVDSEYDSILDELFRSKSHNFKKDLEQAKHAKTELEKDRAFLSAVKALKSDIKTLINFISPEKTPV